MKSETVDWAQVVDSLGAFRQELARLGERVAALETAAGVAPARPPRLFQPPGPPRPRRPPPQRKPRASAKNSS